MLEDLIVSKVRIKMLKLFFRSQGTMYHVREIVRQIDEEINAVRRELARLEKAGLLKSEWRANRRYYELVKSYVFYPELMRLIAKSQGLGGSIIKHRGKLGKVKFAMLASAFVQGRPAGHNDVNLLIVGNIVLPELAALVREEEAARELEINYTVMSEEEFLFRKRRNDPFILLVLAKSRVMLLGDEEAMLES